MITIHEAQIGQSFNLLSRSMYVCMYVCIHIYIYTCFVFEINISSRFQDIFNFIMYLFTFVIAIYSFSPDIKLTFATKTMTIFKTGLMHNCLHSCLDFLGLNLKKIKEMVLKFQYCPPHFTILNHFN